MEVPRCSMCMWPPTPPHPPRHPRARRPPSEMSEHKVTCGVRLDVLDTVLSSIKADLADARYRLVVSGSGDWRFVDLVPAEAGKLQASCPRLGFSTNCSQLAASYSSNAEPPANFIPPSLPPCARRRSSMRGARWASCPSRPWPAATLETTSVGLPCAVRQGAT